MREIKFRAWNKEFRKMQKVTELLFHNPSRVISGFELIDWDEGYSADYFQLDDNFIIMQYTGITDKRGQEIYEGDIVNFNGELVQIEYNEAEAMFWGGINRQRHIFQYCDMLEVIGNIYENPELLKED